MYKVVMMGQRISKYIVSPMLKSSESSKENGLIGLGQSDDFDFDQPTGIRT